MTIGIIHGVGGFAGKHWMQWLHDKLVDEGHTVIMPTLPNALHPDRTEWLHVLEETLPNDKNDELILIGHSLGNASIMDFIEKQTDPIHGYISVAGFYQNYFSELNDYFMEQKEIDLDLVKKNTQKLAVIFGDNDPHVPQDTLLAFAEELGVKPLIIHNGGHLNADAGFTQFPELLDVVHAMIMDS